MPSEPIAIPPLSSPPRFWLLFLAAITIRAGVVLLGLAMASPEMEVNFEDPVPLNIRDRIKAGSARVIEPWFRFDAQWYVNIAEHGYAGAEDKGGRLGPAFLPTMPACMAAASSLGLNPFWAALIAANLAAAAGTAVFARLAAHLTGDRGVGIRAFVLLTAYPASFFLSAPYNEAFGLLFVSLALAAWLKGRSVRAGIAAAMASLSRLTGVALGAAAVGAWLFEDRTRSGLKRTLILVAGSFLGLALFWGYLDIVVGDPFAGLKVQEKWGRKPVSLTNLQLSLESVYNPRQPRWGEGAAVLLFLFLGVRSWVKRGAFWGLVTLIPIGQILVSGSVLSAHRLVMAALPGFVELADLLRNRLAFQITVATFACIQLWLLNHYVHWVFAG